MTFPCISSSVPHKHERQPKIMTLDSKSYTACFHLLAMHRLFMPPTKDNFLYLNKALRISQAFQ